MFKNRVVIAAVLASASIGLASSPALAGKIEKVDMVSEGIDITPIVVRADSSGYTGYEKPSHRYLFRVFAKAKGLNHIYFAGISADRKPHPMVVNHRYFFDQWAPIGNDGWGVFKKSVSFYAAIASTRWYESPKQACLDNMAAEMAKGKSKQDVLRSEWRVRARAEFTFVAAADTKARNKKRDHTFSSVERGHKSVVYPVNVVCKKMN